MSVPLPPPLCPSYSPLPWHLLTSCSFTFVSKDAFSSLCTPSASPSPSPSLACVVPTLLKGRTARLAGPLQLLWEGRAPCFSCRCTWLPVHTAGGHLCRQGCQRLLVSAEVARICPQCPRNFGAGTRSRAGRQHSCQAESRSSGSQAGVSPESLLPPRERELLALEGSESSLLPR